MSDETKQKIYELECENRILRNCLAEAFSMEHRAGFLIREYNRLIDTRQGYDEQVEAFESARREYDRFEERKAMGKIVNVNEDVPHYDYETDPSGVVKKVVQND